MNIKIRNDQGSLEGNASLVIFVVAIVIIAIAVFFGTRDYFSWKDWCRQQGGHVVDHTDWSSGTGFDANGKPVSVTNSDTTYYCLSNDGRILDIR